MHYDPNDVLRHIDQNKVAILLLCGVAMFFNYTWFISALVSGRRNRSITIPLFCSTLWFAHDTSFLFRYDRWFHHYGSQPGVHTASWYPQLFWFALVATSLIELAFIAQAISYGRAEWMPNATQRQWVAFVVGSVALAIVAWTAVKSVLGDDLYVASFGITIVAYPISAIPMILKRRSWSDQTRWMWFGFTGMCLCWFTASSSWFGTFGGAPWIALGLTCFGTGLAMSVLLVRAQRAAAISASPATSPLREAFA